MPMLQGTGTYFLIGALALLSLLFDGPGRALLMLSAAWLMSERIPERPHARHYACGIAVMGMTYVTENGPLSFLMLNAGGGTALYGMIREWSGGWRNRETEPCPKELETLPEPQDPGVPEGRTSGSGRSPSAENTKPEARRPDSQTKDARKPKGRAEPPY